MSDKFTRKNFDEFYLSEGMLSTLGSIGYTTPTPVQAQTIPLVMAGIDLIVQSQTGTGKTAAFAIPIVEMLEPDPGTVEVLVLAPTRELAKQVSEEFARLADFKGISTATIYGGASYGPQYEALETAQIVVATPGRLIDIAERGNIDLSTVRMFALDEADEMLSMGFQEEVDRIIVQLPEDRQSLLFSATITGDVEALGKKMLYYPEFITLSSDQVAAEDVTHEYYPVSGVGRARDLLRVLEYERPENAIIFGNTRNDTFTVTTFLKRHGLRAEVLNGDLPQSERERTLKALKTGQIDFLVATDVAARGIDISDLSHVINYTVPDSAEVYIHRTGRTGRAGKKGKALSLISPREMATLFNIRKFYDVGMKKLTLPSPSDILEANKARHLSKLSQKLEQLEDISYGASLGLARQLVRESEALDEQERIRLIARLIALAEKVGSGEITAESFEAAEAAIVEEKSTDAAAEIDEAEVEFEEADVVHTDEVYEATDDDDDQKEAEKRKAVDSAEDGDRPRRTRRVRRSRGGDDADKGRQEAQSESDKNGREARDDSNGRDSGDRRRRSKSDSDDRRRNGKSRSSRDRDGGSSKSDRGSSKRRGKREETSDETPETSESPKFRMQKLWVNMGRDHFEQPEQVVDMVCHMAGMEPEDLGRVTLSNSFSYVEVRKDYFYDIIEALNNQDWNGVTVSAEPARK